MVSVDIKKIYLLLLTVSTYSSALGPTFLTHIVNQWANGKVTIKSTDPHAGSLVYKGTHYTNTQDEFDVRDISSINYLIPYGFKNNIAPSIIITVYDANNKVISVAHLFQQQKRTLLGPVRLTKQQGSVIPFETHATSASAKVTSNLINNFTIMIDKQGTISIARLLIITFRNNTGVPLEVGSPDCSLTSAIDKMYMQVNSDPTKEHSLTVLFNTNNCKIVATALEENKQVPFGSQSTICLTEQWKKTDQCNNCLVTRSGDHVCCRTDPLTDKNVCDSEGIAWVRGTLVETDAHVFMDYGIIPRQK